MEYSDLGVLKKGLRIVFILHSSQSPYHPQIISLLIRSHPFNSNYYGLNVCSAKIPVSKSLSPR